MIYIERDGIVEEFYTPERVERAIRTLITYEEHVAYSKYQEHAKVSVTITDDVPKTFSNINTDHPVFKNQYDIVVFAVMKFINEIIKLPFKMIPCTDNAADAVFDTIDNIIKNKKYPESSPYDTSRIIDIICSLENDQEYISAEESEALQVLLDPRFYQDTKE